MEGLKYSWDTCEATTAYLQPNKLPRKRNHSGLCIFVRAKGGKGILRAHMYTCICMHTYMYVYTQICIYDICVDLGPFNFSSGPNGAVSKSWPRNAQGLGEAAPLCSWWESYIEGHKGPHKHKDPTVVYYSMLDCSMVYYRMAEYSTEYKHKDPTNHGFWYPPYTGPWNQNVRSLCLCGLFGPYKHNQT